jgi:hypothetical protein
VLEQSRVLAAALPTKAGAASDKATLFTKFVNLSAANVDRAIRFIRTSATKPADELRKLI